MLNRLTAAILFGTAALAAQAQSIADINATSPASAYAQDSRGVIARTPFGLCIRSGSWTPADGVGGCDGQLVAPVAKVVAPAPAATPAPAPAPAIAAIAPPKPAIKPCDSSLTMGIDEAFAFNKAVLSPAAKRRIDSDLPAKLAACSKVDLVLVTGHTDRIGAQLPNQKLSDKRAEAVATYIKSTGVAAPIDTLGAGKTQSIQACDDKLPRKKLIECLAPNRRVTIEIRGPGK
jgi:OOP family OmpA-OmpF porin